MKPYGPGIFFVDMFEIMTSMCFSDMWLFKFSLF